jgi:hypothetical protein
MWTGVRRLPLSLLMVSVDLPLLFMRAETAIRLSPADSHPQNGI